MVQKIARIGRAAILWWNVNYTIQELRKSSWNTRFNGPPSANRGGVPNEFGNFQSNKSLILRPWIKLSLQTSTFSCSVDETTEGALVSSAIEFFQRYLSFLIAETIQKLLHSTQQVMVRDTTAWIVGVTHSAGY